MNTDLVIIPGGVTTAGARCCGERTLQRPLKAAVQRMALERGPCFDSNWKNQETRCDHSLSVDHNSMAVYLTRSDCEMF